MIRSLARIAAVSALVAVAPVTAPADLIIQRDVVVDSMVSDRFIWLDATGQQRQAVLAHNDGQTHPGGSRGGELREYRYQLLPENVTRTVRASGNNFSGFGYVVSHPNSEAICTGGGDTSSLGHFRTGQFQRVFQGRHHAIFRFTLTYPRYCTTAPPAQEFDLPVTIDWVFATGRDHPLWAVTWDLSGVPPGRLMDDSRGPYGELLFDGALTEGSHSPIAGVGWGERYKFTSTTNPVSYESDWDWTQLNSVPHVRLWTTAVDATMGTVQTQTMSQQDAGGYFGIGSWRLTSLSGDACNEGGQVHLMPCDFNWPYQSINYSLDAFGVPSSNTRNTRLAWGTNFGFLGQTQYPVMGSADPAIGGPVGNGDLTNNPYAFEPTLASGYPRKSYSTFIVLDRHSLDPVGAQVAQIQTVQTTLLTTEPGEGVVATSGPAGVNRTDTVTYQPTGWNHVYAAWAIQAQANHVGANFNVQIGTLRHPLVIVSNWTTGTVPGTVLLDSIPLVPDVDYFLSVRPCSQELWITLNRDLGGPINYLEIEPGATVAAPCGSAPGATAGDFDGDGKADLAVFRGSTGEWFVFRSTAGPQTMLFGAPAALGLGDIPVPADYDGDGITDLAIFRAATGEWFIFGSATGFQTRVFGAPASLGLGDIPVPADFDGDGATDLAVYQATIGKWFIFRSTDGYREELFGAPASLGLGHTPVPADYDGDGKADLAVYEAATGKWFIFGSVTGIRTELFGAPAALGLGDVPVPADYDGDGVADLAVFRKATGEWFVFRSTAGPQTMVFGAPAALGLGDIPVPADYDGDGRTDLAVFRASTGDWFIFGTSAGAMGPTPFGAPGLGDVPVNRPAALR